VIGIVETQIEHPLGLSIEMMTGLFILVLLSLLATSFSWSLTQNRRSQDELSLSRRSFFHHTAIIAVATSTSYPTIASAAITYTKEQEKAWNSSPLYTLDDAIGIAQHHDAVAGTSKQHVAYDYAKRIAEGMSDTASFATESLRTLLFGPQSGWLENLSYCRMLNETRCDVSQVSTSFHYPSPIPCV